MEVFRQGTQSHGSSRPKGRWEKLFLGSLRHIELSQLCSGYPCQLSKMGRVIGNTVTPPKTVQFQAYRGTQSRGMRERTIPHTRECWSFYLPPFLWETVEETQLRFLMDE